MLLELIEMISKNSSETLKSIELRYESRKLLITLKKKENRLAQLIERQGSKAT